jgi:hypothetical protein
MYKFIMSVAILLLAGCDNSVVNNSGALLPTEFTGSIWAGNVRYAKVQFVGVDQYGQPQRQSDGAFFGDEYYSDDTGQFTGSIQGAYAGSLIGVASYDNYTHTITPATDTVAAVTENRRTQFRCVIPNGCKNEIGTDVTYGEWYSAPENFEMWGAVSSVVGLEVFNITPATHLAVKFAYSELISDGTSCTDNSCSVDASGLVNGIITPDTIYQANHRLKQTFQLVNSLHINVTPWYDGFIGSDSVAEIESAKHGLISISLQKISTDKNESMMDTLDDWVEIYLGHNGNFYKNALGDASEILDLSRLFQTAVDVAALYVAADKSSSSLASAASTFSQLVPLMNTKDFLEYEELVYNPDTADKILAAQALVAKIQTWAMDFEVNDYSSFFNSDVSADIVTVEAGWTEYSQALSPVMKGLFRPIIKTAEYGLTCLIPIDGCDTSHDLNAYASFSSSEDKMTINASNEPIALDGDSIQYTLLSMDGLFDEELGQTNFKKTFTFNTALINTAEGNVSLNAVDGSLPTVVFWLDAALASGQAPSVVRIDVSIPEMTITSINTTDSYTLKTDAFDVTLLGTRDALDNSSELHYNLSNTHIEGTFSEVDSSNKSIDIRATINSVNADTYYSPTVYPDLEINIDSNAFKDYASFDGEASTFVSNQGGWFTLPKNISVADLPTAGSPGVTEGAAVTFFDRGTFSQWGADYSDLQTLLSLANPASARLGTLVYPGGETALVLFKSDSADTEDMAQQCNKVGEEWGCITAQSLSNLGCGTAFSSTASTVIQAFNWLRSQSCIDQVKIDGRGVYEINYPDLTSTFVNAETFSISLLQPTYLGIESFYVSVISKFKDAQGGAKPTVLLTVNGTAPDPDNVTVSFSLTHNYVGGESSSVLGVDSLIPYGDNSLWLAVAQSSTEQDALIYYIQDANVTLTVFGFDYSDVDSTVNPSHDAPLAVLRYDGQLLGAMRKEGNLYVIRYIDGSWQLL